MCWSRSPWQGRRQAEHRGAQADKPGAPADPIKDKLEKAKEAYRTSIDSLKKEVLDVLETKIAEARKAKNNKAKVEMLASQRADFEKDVSNLPPSRSKSRECFVKRLRSARVELLKAYGQAIRDYTRAKKDAQADAVKAEQEKFVLKITPRVAYRREPEVPGEQPVPRPLLFDPNILISSAWKFTIIGQTTQKGGFKIVDCQIRHGDTDQPCGVAAFGADGHLHLVFENHRRIPSGEAAVWKVANGQGRGVIDCNFDRWRFELVRVR